MRPLRLWQPQAAVAGDPAVHGGVVAGAGGSGVAGGAAAPAVDRVVAVLPGGREVAAGAQPPQVVLGGAGVAPWPGAPGGSPAVSGVFSSPNTKRSTPMIPRPAVIRVVATVAASPGWQPAWPQVRETVRRAPGSGSIPAWARALVKARGSPRWQLEHPRATAAWAPPGSSCERSWHRRQRSTRPRAVADPAPTSAARWCSRSTATVTATPRATATAARMRARCISPS